ncbi:uncharacterized protein LACBIDRAFT_296049 [Laccaria bicolor S238N-H82]|uniref:Predicted protein n=1 Tax=Laccaria bicolor (strain S238N-H82 / ATCC MYA-4686) TaxID=486041 RepID=B0E2Q3_LACBS|nr:uncharacterized protein LACBIDRAFT_296049 [Laccaria bicolor S238N-H82]EDQ98884.1 predicted protein [Laccaria bicolor S238N-H82]|eukprot:XP_001890463.1 predicted protein [Laccaria bicolor S238N-H82]
MLDFGESQTRTSVTLILQALPAPTSNTQHVLHINHHNQPPFCRLTSTIMVSSPESLSCKSSSSSFRMPPLMSNAATLRAHSPPAVDLCHMTSGLGSPTKHPQPSLRSNEPRLGSRSPNSIPSSPTLVSSSSSSPTMTTAQEHPLASLPEPDDGDVGAGDETEDSAKGRKRKAQAKGKEELRCEKIANLLVEGKKGADLEKAVSLSAVPLTHMFKRSLSLPSSNPRSTLPAITITLPSDAASPGDGEASRMGTPGTPSLRRPPYSQRDTAALFPLICTPFTSYGPRHLQSEDEEARRRSELSQKGWYWWLSSGLEDQIADSGCERPMIADGMGYEDPVGQYDYQYIEQYDRRPSLDPIPPPVSTDPSNYFYTSPSAPLPASSFSTLSGWAGDYKYDETSHRQTSSAVNATVSAPIPAWYEAPGWEAHQHQFNHPNLYFSPDDWDQIEVNHEEDRHIGRRS